jgi:phospholipase C
LSSQDNKPTTRRDFLIASGGVVAGAALGPSAAGALSRKRARLWAHPDLSRPRADQLEALRVLGKHSLRMPDTLPYPHISAGTDMLPQIEHVVVAMMENHSYDNFLGMLGRGPFEKPRGDGYRIAADGHPANSNPKANGKQLRAFHMPTTCQFGGKPTQEWEQAHIQYARGTNQGFVVSGSGDVAMGYWDGGDLPFTYDIANTFPIGDRYFCSLLGQTDPNRRYLIAATSCGMTDDIPLPNQDATLAISPHHGTIFTRLSNAGISWFEYVEQDQATSITENLYPTDDSLYNTAHVKKFANFFTDAAAGSLPQFSLLDPNFSTQSQENPQNIVVGEAWLRTVVEAIGSSPAWRSTVLIINYDEHGGYYDHVPPPAALAPDDYTPVVEPRESKYDGFKRYGFRVPAIVVSPYAKTDYVSHMVYDHSSVCAFVEHKFNLASMTLRDANANNMLDFLDLDALTAGTPTFPEMPSLAQSGDTAKTRECSTSGPGTIPTPQPKPLPIKVRLQPGRQSTVHGGSYNLPLQASRSVSGLTVELQKDHKLIGKRAVSHLGVDGQTITLRPRRGKATAGRYTVVVRHGTKQLSSLTVGIKTA